VLFSFLKRIVAHPSSPPPDTRSGVTVWKEIAHEAGGNFFADFKLYHYESVTTVDLLLFIPERGIYIGEKISWRYNELKKARIERSAPGERKKGSTRFNAVESAIRRKLEDVLSFDSTPCERFIWMEHLTETEFDALDPSFHELLPKSRLVFADESGSSIRQKLETLACAQNEPYSALKVIGSLNAHTLLLPTPDAPFGTFLSDEQLRFLETEYTDTFTTLCGGPGSGKSTLLLRTALKALLEKPERKVLIITPTLLAGELLRNKLVSLMEYGAFTIPLGSISFYSPLLSEPLETLGFFKEASLIICDDSYRMDEDFIQKLTEQRGNRRLLFSTVHDPESDENVFFLRNRYRDAKTVSTLRATAQELPSTFLRELRKQLNESPPHDIMLILPDHQTLLQLKGTIDEGFGLNCRILDSGFSLQYQNLDDLLLATPEYVSGIRIPHLFLIVPENSGDYRFELSRASETATIITYPNSDGESDGENR
jgi:hypothetical protein